MIKNIVGYVTKILNQQSVAENVKRWEPALGL